MYRELLSEGAYDSATEYAQLLAFAKAEFEEEVAKEEYKREYFNQIEPRAESECELGIQDITICNDIGGGAVVTANEPN